MAGTMPCLNIAKVKLKKAKRAKFIDDEMSVAFCPSKSVQIHYEALPVSAWRMKSHENTYVKSVIAHLWFVIIHPYDDGNGCMARALVHYCLADESIKPFSISSIIYANKKVIMKF